MTTTLIVSGGGDFTDPWHPFEATSELLRELLADEGHTVTVTTDVIASLVGLGEDGREKNAHGETSLGESGRGKPADAAANPALPDLVVINAGNAEQPTPGDAAAIAGLERYLATGRPLLVMHVATTAFPEVDAWEDIVGGRWVRGTTMHPDWDHGTVHVATDAHPVVAGIHDFQIWDERYSYLRVAPGIVPLATQEHDGLEHPILWAKQHGDARVVYDALGHEPQSYESEPHRQIIRNAAAWLTE
jgi:type 1 glutamine amidotransferase